MIYILDNYDFLKDLVEEGQADKKAPFLKNGLCLANKPKEPNHVFVFHFDENYNIWCSYAWTDKKNKSFYKFMQELYKLMKKFKMPILRYGANDDLKNHTIEYGTLGNYKVYKFQGVK